MNIREMQILKQLYERSYIDYTYPRVAGNINFGISEAPYHFT